MGDGCCRNDGFSRVVCATRNRMTAGRSLCARSLAAALVGSAPGTVGAQSEATLKASVIEQVARTPVPGITVSIDGTGKTGRTDDSGRVVLAGVPAGIRTVTIRALGYQALAEQFSFVAGQVIEWQFTLRRTATALDTVKVKETVIHDTKLAGYLERKARGFGHFIDDSIWAKYESSRISDVLSRIPGLRIKAGSGTTNAFVVNTRGQLRAFQTCPINSPGGSCDGDPAMGAPVGLCYADIYLDGAPMFTAGHGTRPFSVNELQASDIQGAEYYAGAASMPIEYNKTGSGCGVLLLWTRTGPRREKP
jgi:hypothetical protein